MSTEFRYLTLKSSDINMSNNASDYFNTTVENSVGIVTQNRRSITWKNVNLQKIMGDEYFNKYSSFSIRLVSRGIGLTRTTSTPRDQNVVYYLSGLSFIPSTPRVKIDTRTNSVNLNYYLVNIENFASNENAAYTFTKPSSEVNLTMEILNNSTLAFYQPTVPSSLLGHSVYTLEIRGVL